MSTQPSERPCEHEALMWDRRKLNHFIPPLMELRPRCPICNWQGTWRTLDDVIAMWSK